MSTFFNYCENVEAENASMIPEAVYALLTAKFFMYMDSTSGDSMLLNIDCGGKRESYNIESLDFDAWNDFKIRTCPVSITLSGEYDDCGSAILHALEEFIEQADESLFESFSYRLSYTADGSAPCTYAARKEADGSIFRGAVEAQKMSEFPAGDWAMTDYALHYYREKREAEESATLAPLMEKLSKLSRDNNFNMDEFLNEDCAEYMFYDVPMSTAAEVESFWKLREEIDSCMKNGETDGLPMLIDRTSAKSMTVDYDGKPLYMIKA